MLQALDLVPKRRDQGLGRLGALAQQQVLLLDLLKTLQFLGDLGGDDGKLC